MAFERTMQRVHILPCVLCIIQLGLVLSAIYRGRGIHIALLDTTIRPSHKPTLSRDFLDTTGTFPFSLLNGCARVDR
ncbi:hypothetical protein C8Q70DRAFT_73633 [Cubamyces menziesii]|nr:hypothetical protein C8Q70DRAFT_73633 [Cubamyces menziesii]